MALIAFITCAPFSFPRSVYIFHLAILSTTRVIRRHAPHHSAGRPGSSAVAQRSSGLGCGSHEHAGKACGRPPLGAKQTRDVELARARRKPSPGPAGQASRMRFPSNTTAGLDRASAHSPPAAGATSQVCMARKLKPGARVDRIGVGCAGAHRPFATPFFISTLGEGTGARLDVHPASSGGPLGRMKLVCGRGRPASGSRRTMHRRRPYP